MNCAVKSFTSLHAWRKAHELSLWIYRATQTYPRYEQYGLADQLRRASVSITSNIAEGFGRRSPADKAYRYGLALGSLYEVQNQLLISRDVGFLDRTTFLEIASLTKDVSRLINRLISSMISLRDRDP